MQINYQNAVIRWWNVPRYLMSYYAELNGVLKGWTSKNPVMTWERYQWEKASAEWFAEYYKNNK